MQATPQDIPGGIPNGRDTAETRAHPGQMLDTPAMAHSVEIVLGAFLQIVTKL